MSGEYGERTMGVNENHLLLCLNSSSCSVAFVSSRADDLWCRYMVIEAASKTRGMERTAG
eukprot:131245-Amorphochlora_amoeboformis.AAC.2